MLASLPFKGALSRPFSSSTSLRLIYSTSSFNQSISPLRRTINHSNITPLQSSRNSSSKKKPMSPSFESLPENITAEVAARGPQSPPAEEKAADGAFPTVFLGTKRRLPEFILTEKVVCVSGGARGLGLTQAEALLEAGATGKCHPLLFQSQSPLGIRGFPLLEYTLLAQR